MKSSHYLNHGVSIQSGLEQWIGRQTGNALSVRLKKPIRKEKLIRILPPAVLPVETKTDANEVVKKANPWKILSVFKRLFKWR